MVEGGMKCVKYLLFVFNLIFFLVGIVLIIIGTLIKTKFSEYFDFFDVAAVLLIVVGVVVFTVGFFGCCGAYKESYFLVIAFAVLLSVVLLLEVATAIAAQVKSHELENLVRDQLSSTAHSYPKVNHVRDLWDGIQAQLHCCGSSNYTDWSFNSFLNATSSVPDSCCVQVATNCGKGLLVGEPGNTQVHTQGCTDRIASLINSNIAIVVGSAVGLALIQAADVVLACILARAIKRECDAGS